MTQNPVGDLIVDQGGAKVQVSFYPGYHCGRIWRNVEPNKYYWELELMEHGETPSISIGAGEAATLREANEAMSAIMHLWALSGKNIFEDYGENPLPEVQGELGFLAATGAG